jgi:hypothetical protein
MDTKNLTPQERRELAIELTKLRYAAMLRALYHLGMDMDRNIANWSSIALAGLLALAVNRHEEPSFCGALWALAVLFFMLACAFTYFNMWEAKKQHEEETDDFIAEIPLEQNKKDEKAIRIGNIALFSCFVFGVISSILLVGIIVFC